MSNERKEAGYTLVGVLLVFTILAILGMSLVMLSLASVKTSTKERDNQSVYYIAEAGLNYVMNGVEKEVEAAYESAQEEMDRLYDENAQYEANEQFEYMLKPGEIREKGREKFYQELENRIEKYKEENDYRTPDGMFEEVRSAENELFEPFAEVSVTPGEGDDEGEGNFIVTSTGNIVKSSRILSMTFEVQFDSIESGDGGGGRYGNAPPFAVFTSGQFTMDNGTIHGDIGTVNEQNGAINFPGGGLTLNGDVRVPGGERSIVNQAHWFNMNVEEIDPSYKMPQLPPFLNYPTNLPNYPGNDLILDWNDKSKYTLNLTDNIEINRLYIPSGLHDFTINLNGQDRIMVVNKLESMGSINITGNGKLTIMVKSEMKFGSGNVNSLANVKGLDIFYAGIKEPNFGGSMKIFGNVYVKQAKLTIAGSSGIQGNIFYKGNNSIEITGGSENIAQMFFAPNAHVKFTGGGTLTGKVIAKDFTITGGGTVHFSSPDIDENLFYPDVSGESNDENNETGTEESEDNPSINPLTPIREIQPE